MINMKKITSERILGKLGTIFTISFIVSLILVPWVDGYHIKLFIHMLISLFLAHICFSSLDKNKNTKTK